MNVAVRRFLAVECSCISYCQVVLCWVSKYCCCCVAVVVVDIAVVALCRKEEGIGNGDRNLCKNKKASRSLSLPGRSNRNQHHDIEVYSFEPIIPSRVNGKVCVEKYDGYASDMRKLQLTKGTIPSW